MRKNFASLILAIAFVVFAVGDCCSAAFAQEESKQAQTTVVGVEGRDTGANGETIDPDRATALANSKIDLKEEFHRVFSNTETLFNVAANATEIGCIASVPFYFIAAILSFIRSRRKLGVMLIGACVGAAVVGLATPGIINLIVASARDSQLDIKPFGIPIAVVAGAIVVLNTLTVILLPGLIALYENHPKKWIIFGLSFVAEFVPLCLGWLGLLVWTLWSPKPSADLGKIPSPTDFSNPKWNS